MSQRILKDSTSPLWTYPPVLAQATSATARIRTPAFDLPDVGSSATVDSTAADVTADALEGAIELAVDSTAWMRGRRYIATSTTGDKFPILAATDGTSDTLDLQEPIPSALLTNSTIEGYRISIALTADQTAELGTACLVEWTAVIGGQTYTWTDDFAIVARDAAYTLDAITLVQSSPFARRLKPDADRDFSETIDAAWRRYVQPALLAKGIRPHLFISRAELEPAHIAAVEHFLAQDGDSVPQDVRDEKRREYQEALTLALNSESLWIEDEAQNLPPPAPDGPRPWTVTLVTR